MSETADNSGGMKSSAPKSGGGSATASGISFQAAVMAIAAIHLARGIPLGWLTGLSNDIPVCLAAETGGPGDDIQVRLHDGELIEAQIKRGLSAGPRLWDSLIALSHGIQEDRIAYGILIVVNGRVNARIYGGGAPSEEGSE